MDRKLESIISVLFWFIPFWGWDILISSSVNREMTEGDALVKKLKYSTFKEIKSAMLSVKWIYRPEYPNSLFTYNFGDNYFHAGVYRFGDVGYLLTPYGYLMANLLQKKIRKSLPSYKQNKKLYIK